MAPCLSGNALLVALICTFLFKTTKQNKPLNIISGTLQLRLMCSLCSIEMFTFALIDRPSPLAHSPLEHRPFHKANFI